MSVVLHHHTALIEESKQMSVISCIICIHIGNDLLRTIQIWSICRSVEESSLDAAIHGTATRIDAQQFRNDRLVYHVGARAPTGIVVIVARLICPRHPIVQVKISGVF